MSITKWENLGGHFFIWDLFLPCVNFFFYQFLWSAKMWKRNSEEFSFMCETKWIKCQEENTKMFIFETEWKKMPSMKSWTENSRNFGWNQVKKNKNKLSWEKKRKNPRVKPSDVFPWSYFSRLKSEWKKKNIVGRENLFSSWKCEKNFTLISFHVQNQMKKKQIMTRSTDNMSDSCLIWWNETSITSEHSDLTEEVD